jgi:hypothetical protein
MKIRLEKQRLEKVKEQEQKDLREVEWEKRKRACHVRKQAEAEEDATKYPCWT